MVKLYKQIFKPVPAETLAWPAKTSLGWQLRLVLAVFVCRAEYGDFLPTAQDTFMFLFHLRFYLLTCVNHNKILLTLTNHLFSISVFPISVLGAAIPVCLGCLPNSTFQGEADDFNQVFYIVWHLKYLKYTHNVSTKLLKKLFTNGIQFQHISVCHKSRFESCSTSHCTFWNRTFGHMNMKW